MVKQARVFGALIITIVICSFCNIILSEKTLAYDNKLYSDCIGAAPASQSISAIEGACRSCASDTRYKWGALWIGPRGNKDASSISISSSDKDNHAYPISLYGAAYTCLKDNGTMTATDIDLQVSYISPINPGELSRVASNAQKQWSGVSSSDLTLDVPAFIEAAKSKGQTSETEIASSKITTYWDSVPVKRAMNHQITTVHDVTISLSVTDTKDTPVNQECTPEDCPTTDLKQGRIYSFSWPNPVAQVIKNTENANIEFRHVMGSIGLEESMSVTYHVWNANIASSDCSEEQNNSFWNKIFDKISSLFQNAFIAKGSRTFNGTQTATDVNPGSPNSVTVNGCIAKGKTKPVVVPVAQAITWGDVQGLWEAIVDVIKNSATLAKIFLPRIAALIGGGDPEQLSEYEQQQAAAAGQNVLVGMINASKQMGASAAVAIVIIEPDDYPFRIEALEPSVTAVEYGSKEVNLENGIYTIYGDSDSVTAKFKHILKRTDNSTQVPVVGGSATKGGIQARGKNDKTSIKMTNDGFEINQERTYNDVITDTVELGEKKEICSGLTFNPKSGKANTEGKITESDGSGESNICVTIGHPYNFKLTPTVNDPSETIVYAGTNQTFSAKIHNEPNDSSHPGTKSTPIKAKYISFVTSSSYSAAFKGNDPTSPTMYPCDFYNSLSPQYRSCNDITNLGDNKGIDTGGDKTIDGITLSIPDINVGDKFCFAIAVAPANSGEGYNPINDNIWNVSGLTCRTIAKKPTFQVLGGSLYSAKDILASTTTKNDGYIYGSWVEYAVVAKGLVDHSNEKLGLASGAGNNQVASNTNFSSRSKLTIANKTSNDTEYGNSGIDISLFKDVAKTIRARYANDGACTKENELQTILQPPVNNQYYYYCSSGDITIDKDLGIGSSSFIPNDTQTFAIIYSGGDINIREDITFYNNYSSNIAQAKQVIFIADGNININGVSVQTIDAWLIADADGTGGGYIDTCKEGAIGSINADNCSLQLTVKGPVFAKNLILDRTAGMGPAEQSTTPAEKFILPIESYYWAYDQAQKNASFYNASINELAPRY